LKDFIDPRFLNSVIDEERATVNYQGPQQIEQDQLNIDSYLKHKRQTIEIFLKSATKAPSRTVSINNINQQTDSNSRIPENAGTSSTSDIPSTSYQSDQVINSSSLAEPIFCNSSCRNCTVSPLYSIEQLNTINGTRRLVGQLKLNDELSKHGHPKSRKMPNNKLRTTEQALLELLEHYKYFHKLT
jgi:hypothetical protein